MREKFVLPDVGGSHVNPSHAGLQTSQQPCQYPVARGKSAFSNGSGRLVYAHYPATL